MGRRAGSLGGLLPGEQGAPQWPCLVTLCCSQVSSYGGILSYELHSETQRGDVFIPAEGRPDVVLQVEPPGGAAVGAGERGSRGAAALTPFPCLSRAIK